MSEMTSTPAAAPPPPPPPPAVFPVSAPVAAAPGPQLKSPGLAGVLSALPGLGHVYLGLYQRAAAFFAVWVVAITLADRSHHDAPFGLLVAFWWFFVLIDAVRQAKAINATGAAESNLVFTEKPIRASGSLALGVFLILVGLFFLLDRFVTIDLSFLVDWWPLLLVGFGGWQVLTYMKAKKEAEEARGATDAINV